MSSPTDADQATAALYQRHAPAAQRSLAPLGGSREEAKNAAQRSCISRVRRDRSRFGAHYAGP